MAVKYVKDFIFGPMTSVQRYAKGGHVTKVPAKAKPAAKGMPAKAKPNAPATGAKRMESPPKVGKGQGYKDGGKVPGKQMDRQPTNTPPGRKQALAPAKPFKGEYQGYAKGGKARRYAEGGDIEDPRAASIEPGDGAPQVQYNQYGEADPFEGRPVRYEGAPVHYESALERLPQLPDESSGLGQIGAQVIIPSERNGQSGYYTDTTMRNFVPNNRPDMKYEPDALGNRPERLYEGTGPAAQAFMDREQAMRDALARTGAPSTLTEATFPVATAQELKRPEPNDNAWFDSLLRLAQQEQAQPSRGYLNAAEGLSGIGRAMREGAMRADMMRRPGMPGERTAMYAKGGQVKGQAKVGKVMSEYKAGELHSGSKKGPLVKNPKQAVAIALSEARKAGAKIPKKEEGGLMASRPAVSKPKSVSVTKVTKTVSDGKDAALNERKMLEFLRSLSKDEVADMMEQRAMKAPSMDPDMPNYRKGGMAKGGKWIQEAIKKPGSLRRSLGVKEGQKIPAAKLEKATHSQNPTTARRARLAQTLRGMGKARGGVPVHKGKAMYGGGKC